MIDKEKIFREKRKISIYSIIVNFTLATIKFAGGIFANSAALVADGIHSLSDLAASLSVYLGIVISNKKSKTFPYGLYKVENLVALVSAFAIFFAGYEIAREVLFEPPKEITSLPVALAVIGATIIITFSYAAWELKKGKQLNSPSLIADAQHVKTDFFSTLIVLVGILGQYFNIVWLEKGAVVVVVIFIFHSGWEILKESIKVLLDASVDSKTMQQVYNLLRSENMISEIKNVTGRSSGSYIFLELDLVLATNNLEKAHDFSEQLEEKLKKEIPFVEKVLIHFEHGHKQKKIAVLAKEDGTLCTHFGSCPQIVIFTDNNGQWEKEILLNPAAKLEKRKGIELAEYLRHKQITCLVVKENLHSKSAEYALENAMIDIVITDKKTVDEIDPEKLDCH